MLRSIAARRERRCFQSRSALRCVSKHEGACKRPVLILRDGAARLLRMRPSRRAHARSSSQKLSRVRAPQDEDDHRLRHSSPCQTAHLVPAARFCARALPLCFAHPQSRGGRSAERRSGACEAPVGHAMTRHVRRLRGALRPMTRDARLSALHRGGFGLPGPRFRHRHLRRISCSELLAARS
jgi:hypothetical protein